MLKLKLKCTRGEGGEGDWGDKADLLGPVKHVTHRDEKQVETVIALVPILSH